MTNKTGSVHIPEFIAAMFLNGLRRSMKTMPILNICTPPPDMYNMNACIGSDFAGEIAKSHALLSFRAAYDAEVAPEGLLRALDWKKW